MRLVRLRPERLAEEARHLVTGRAAVERYVARIDAHDVHCMRCAEGAAGDH